MYDSRSNFGGSGGRQLGSHNGEVSALPLTASAFSPILCLKKAEFSMSPAMVEVWFSCLWRPRVARSASGAVSELSTRGFVSTGLAREYPSDWV